MTTVYLSYGTWGNKTLLNHSEDGPVNLLVSILVWNAFKRYAQRFCIGDLIVDSGAFSSFNSGIDVTYEDWRRIIKTVDASEIFSLDVIGDAAASEENWSRAVSDGIEAIPTFHYGESWKHLSKMAEQSKKIALGGMARINDSKRLKWIGQCFSRVWPKQIHGFGCSSWKQIQEFPFHSVDASSWCYAPAAMGAWCGYTGRQISLKSRGVRDYWIEVLEHQKRERWAKQRWKKELRCLK